MRFRITFKDPDGVGDSLDREAKAQAETTTGVLPDEMDDLIASRREKLSEALDPWVKYDEYVTIEFDTDAGTASVVRRAGV